MTLNQEVLNLLETVETVDITTRGRNSGADRRIEIWMYAINGRYIITGTPGPRDWMANLSAHPYLTLHLPGGVDLQARVTPVADRQLRTEVFTAEKTWWYRSQTTVDDLVDNSPMVELHLEA